MLNNAARHEPMIRAPYNLSTVLPQYLYGEEYLDRRTLSITSVVFVSSTNGKPTLNRPWQRIELRAQHRRRTINTSTWIPSGISNAICARNTMFLLVVTLCTS